MGKGHKLDQLTYRLEQCSIITLQTHKHTLRFHMIESTWSWQFRTINPHMVPSEGFFAPNAARNRSHPWLPFIVLPSE